MFAVAIYSTLQLAHAQISNKVAILLDSAHI